MKDLWCWLVCDLGTRTFWWLENTILESPTASRGGEPKSCQVLHLLYLRLVEDHKATSRRCSSVSMAGMSCKGGGQLLLSISRCTRRSTLSSLLRCVAAQDIHDRVPYSR